MSDGDVAALAHDLSGAYKGRIASVQEVEVPSRGKTIADRLESALFWQRHRLQCVRQRVKRRLGV